MKTGLILYRMAVPAALLASLWLRDSPLLNMPLMDMVVESALLGGKSWVLASAELPYLGH